MSKEILQQRELTRHFIYSTVHQLPNYAEIEK